MEEKLCGFFGKPVVSGWRSFPWSSVCFWKKTLKAFALSTSSCSVVAVSLIRSGIIIDRWVVFPVIDFTQDQKRVSEVELREEWKRVIVYRLSALRSRWATLFRWRWNATLSSCSRNFLNFLKRECLSFISCSIFPVIQGSFGLNLRIILEGTNSAAISRNAYFQESQVESVSGACCTNSSPLWTVRHFRPFVHSLLQRPENRWLCLDGHWHVRKNKMCACVRANTTWRRRKEKKISIFTSSSK